MQPKSAICFRNYVQNSRLNISEENGGNDETRSRDLCCDSAAWLGLEPRPLAKWKSAMTNGSFGYGSGMVKGIDAKLLNDGERSGDYGLCGLRERAKLLGGKLAVWSELNAGTELELRIPATNAYAAADGGKRSWLAEKLSGEDTEKS